MVVLLTKFRLFSGPIKNNRYLNIFRFTLEDGPVFHIQEKMLTRAMGLVWDNTTGLSSKTKGILGQFMHRAIYRITYHEHTLNMGTLHIK